MLQTKSATGSNRPATIRTTLLSWPCAIWAFLATMSRRGLSGQRRLDHAEPQKSKSKESTFQMLHRRFDHPIREGADFFILTASGDKVPIDSLTASSKLQAWAEVVGGAMVYIKPKQ